ncbi:hypothetical protein [Niveibacterium terrae]|uniref:hypothetical protein n=1 Tax=Niveibacterium terrae TaxID=3373598 RepID=UPI003A8D8D0E
MNPFKRIAIAVLSAFGLAVHAQTESPQKSGADVMRELRLRALSAPAEHFGISPSRDFPRTYAVLIDFPINDQTATIVSFSDGSSSLYTTSTFGIIGGGAHEKVKLASQRLIVAADEFFERAEPTEEYPYPGKGKVCFYLVTFQGVRVLETALSDIESAQSELSSLFWAGQEVLTQLRLSTEKR